MHKREARGSFALLALLVLTTAPLAGCNDDENAADDRASAPDSSSPPPSLALPEPAGHSATVHWLAPTTASDGSTLTDLAGYRIHYGTDVAELDHTIEIRNPGMLTYVIENLAPGTYYFAVTAVNSNNHESERSNAGRKIIS